MLCLQMDTSSLMPRTCACNEHVSGDDATGAGGSGVPEAAVF